jgi:hypothetical protein
MMGKAIFGFRFSGPLSFLMSVPSATDEPLVELNPAQAQKGGCCPLPTPLS